MAINTICNPRDTISHEEHKHFCNVCHTCWAHSNKCGNGHATERQFREAHSCPTCGNFVTSKFYPETVSERLLEAHDINDVIVWYARLMAVQTSDREARVRREIAEQFYR